MVRAEAGAHHGHVWVRSRTLVVGRMDSAGGSAVKPLEDYAPVALPPDSGGWRQVGQGCRGPLDDSGPGGFVEVHTAAPDPTARAELLWREERAGPVLGIGLLPAAVTPCEVVMGELDEKAGPEAAVVWTVGDTVGVTVWALPGPVEAFPGRGPEAPR